MGGGRKTPYRGERVKKERKERGREREEFFKERKRGGRVERSHQRTKGKGVKKSRVGKGEEGGEGTKAGKSILKGKEGGEPKENSSARVSRHRSTKSTFVEPGQKGEEPVDKTTKGAKEKKTEVNKRSSFREEGKTRENLDKEKRGLPKKKGVDIGRQSF